MNKTIASTALIPNSLPVPALHGLAPLGSLEAYISSVHQIPVLSVEDEQALARRFHDDNDLGAAREAQIAKTDHERIHGHGAAD